MAEAGGSCRGGAKGELLFLLLVILTFIAAYRLRETGVFSTSFSGADFSRISNQDMLDLINTTAAVPDRAERLRRIDTVVSVYGDDKTPHIDYGITWLLAFRAADGKNDVDKISAYNAILRRHASRAELPARTISLLNRVAVRKAALMGDMETLKKAAEENAGSSHPYHRHERMLALNKLGRAAADANVKRRYFDLALAEYREGDQDEGVLVQAADALGNKAMLTKGNEREALLCEMLKHAQSLPDRYAREEILLWIRLSLAQEAEPAERLDLFEKIVGEYKDGTSEYIRDQLRSIVGRIVTLARERPDRGEILDRLAAELRGSASKDLAARVVMEHTGMLSGDAEKAEAYRAVVDEFKDADDASAREQVVSAARNYLKLSADKTAAALICGEVAALYESGVNRRVSGDIARMLSDAMDAVSGDTEKLAAANRLLDYAKRTRNPLNAFSLEKAFEEKVRLENTPDAAKRFFSEWIAGAGSDDELFRALRMKLSAGNELAKEARGEIIAEFADTSDAEQARLVVKALDGLSQRFPWPLGNISDEEIRLYNTLIDRFAGAKDVAGLGVYMSALKGKATGIDDVAERAALCDRILATPIPAGARSLEWIRESAARVKGMALGAPEILAQYYAERVAKTSSPWQKAQLLLSQAKNEPSRAKKEALFEQIIADYRETPNLESSVVEAFIGRANLAADREEARRRYREAVEYVTGLKRKRQSIPSLLYEAYEKLFEMAPGRREKIALYDEQIQFFQQEDRKAELARIVMRKAELVDVPEKSALYDKAIELLSDSKEPVAYSLMDALLAKAEAIEDGEEKMALYDRIIAFESAREGDFFYRMNLAAAVAGKANLSGDSQYLDDYLGVIFQREDSSDANAGFVLELLGKIKDRHIRDAGYEKILRRYSGESSRDMSEIFDHIHVLRACSSGDFDEVMRLLEKRSADENYSAIETLWEQWEAGTERRESGKDALNRRLAGTKTDAEKRALFDEFIRNAADQTNAHEVVRLLFLKADVVTDTEVKSRIFDEILDWSIGWRSFSLTRSWRDAEKAVEARAALLGDPAKKAEYYDFLLEQYDKAGGSFNAVHFLSALHVGRAALIDDRVERKAAIERSLGKLGGLWGVSRRSLEPLYSAWTDLNAENVRP